MKACSSFLLFLSLVFTCLAQSDVADAALAAEQSRRAALLAGDVAALDAVLADDLRYIHSNGKLETKAQVMELFASKQVAYRRYELANLEARRVTSDVVVVTGSIDQDKLSGGKWTELKLLFQAVWRRDAEGWRQVALQTVRPPEPGR